MKRKWLKPASLLVLAVFLNQLFFPTVSYALTGGPTQPEVHGFEPVNSNQMVDLFTGDFTYSIPLMDVGGYPLNLAYHAGVKMDQEASMVGLGWSLTPGAINRTIRGIPDDFQGDEINTQQNMKANETWGIGMNFPIEAIGIDLSEKLFNASFGFETYYNSYKGFGTKTRAGVGFDFRKFNEDANSGADEGSFLNGGLSLNITSDSKNGISLNPSLSMQYSATFTDAKDGVTSKTGNTASTFNNVTSKSVSLGSSIGMNFNSGNGFSALSYSKGISTNSTSLYEQLGVDGHKRTRGHTSSSLSTSIGYTAYLPSQPNDMLNYNAGLNFSADGDFWGIDGQVQFNGYYSTQWMPNSEKDKSSAAYGALYNSRIGARATEKSQGMDRLLDFNRTTDYAYQAGATNLQLSQTTHDVYSIAGQGTGGTFRLHSNDIPVYGDPVNYNRSTAFPSASVGLEYGPFTKFGANFGASSHYSHSGAWLEAAGNEFAKNNSMAIAGQNAFFEQQYFMKSGEMTPWDENIVDYDEGIAPSRPVIDPTNSFEEFKLRDKLTTLGSTKSVSTASRASGRLYERRGRNTAIEYLTNAEAKRYGINRSIFSYGELLTDSQYQTDVAKVYARASISDVTNMAVRKEHHIGAFKITEANGTKYIYDLPAYNFSAAEVAFDINAKEKSGSKAYDYYKDYQRTGLISYDTTDASVNNTNGESNFFQKKSVPAHAHAYMLTGILSPDYVDVLGDGITEDDLGTAVKFNYSLHSDTYGWRSPYDSSKARYNEVTRSKEEDDKASYSYGTKELWYIHSVESKTHVAEFYYSDREDALGVSDEHGTKGSTTDQKMQKLDRIELYNKADRFINRDNAVPIKVVHFTYSYDLCKGVPNHVNSATNGGKLTLKKLSFSYGRSKKAMMSPYIFKYGENPDYDPLAYDSWGNYKPNDVDFPNNYFPYPEQAAGSAKTYASAWNLSRIKLPSGGQMDIEYESDDYAYVMERDAHRMFRLKGMSDNTSMFTGNGAWEKTDRNVLYDDDNEHLYLFFDMESSAYNDQVVKDQYMPHDSILYYKFSTYIKEQNEPEFVAGFVEIEDMGRDAQNSSVGWMKIKPHEPDVGKDVHPISFDAWNYFLQNFNEKVFDGEEVPESGADNGITKNIDVVFNQLENVLGFATGKYSMMKRKKYASQVELDQCVMRLKDPDGIKYGGGHRVKQITMTDNWSDATTANYGDGTYGTVYYYDEDEGGLGASASTGVASYETAFGTDENPYRLPISFDIHKFPGKVKKEITDKWYYKFITNEAEIMGPVGEAFFPNPMVGYSKVTVKSLATENDNGTPTGHMVHQFYTTRSHPIRFEQTPIEHHYRNTNPILAFLSGTSWTRTAASQGYTVIANDMNGRPFSVESFDHKGDLISGTKYLYNTKADKSIVGDGSLGSDQAIKSVDQFEELQLDYSGSENNYLDNEVRVLDRYGNLKDRTLGMEYDIALDTRASRSISWSGSFDPNLDIMVIAGIPIVLPMLLFGSNYQKSKFNSAVATKVVQQHGILKSVVAFDEQSVVQTENVLWDEETGRVLLTKTYNEYNDAISNFSYPAHYAYQNLGSPVKNQRLNWESLTFENGIATITGTATDYFTPGDQLAMHWVSHVENDDGNTLSQSKSILGWVKKVKDDQLYVVDRDGTPISGHVLNMTVIESGYKNILGASIGGFTTMETMDVSQTSFQTPAEVTQASAATFSDQWQTYDDEVTVTKCKLDSGIAFMLERILDSAAYEDISYFDTLANTDDGKRYHLARVSGFKTSPIAKKLKKHTGYLREVSGTCTNTNYTDTLFIYNVTLSNGQSAEVRFTGARPASSSMSQYESWYLDRYFLVNRQSKDNCVYDTAYGNFLAYNAAKSIGGSFHFSLGKLGENLDVDYCEFVLHDTTTNSILALNQITGFDNIRLNRFVNDGRSFYVDAQTASGTVTLQGSTNCFPIGECWKECKRNVGDTINPYVVGVRGIWRGKDNYAYHDDRIVTVAANEYSDQTMIRHDGAFAYNPLWTFDVVNGGLDFANNTDNWISPATLTKVSPAGNHVESVDALGRPSAEIYGYQRKLVTGVAQNAGHHEIGFDGFEDYDYPFYNGCRKEAHWALQENRFDLVAKATTLSNNPLVQAASLDNMTIFLSQDTAHTGRVSLRVPKNNFVSATNVFFDSDTSTYERNRSEPYRLGNGEVIQNFALEKGEKYVISGWVKEGSDTSRTLSNYSNSYLRVKVNGISQSTDFYPDGPIIEGWQRIFGEFSIPDTTAASSISIEAVTGNVLGNEAYFDDIRIQPYNSAMVAYVYDPVTLRLTAELDENNFATFYEYDQEGRLLRIKKETEQGIVTLQESRYGIPKQ